MQWEEEGDIGHRRRKKAYLLNIMNGRSAAPEDTEERRAEEAASTIPKVISTNGCQPG
jgi:hypothetical protein